MREINPEIIQKLKEISALPKEELLTIKQMRIKLSGLECHFLCREYCIADKDYDPETCPIKYHDTHKDEVRR